MFEIPRSEQTAWKNFSANFFSLSDINVLGGPYLKTYDSTNATAAVQASNLRKGTTCVNFEKRSDMTRRNR